jgi:hypothetical protein
MRWFRFIDFWTPQVFSPKVMPDPGSAARLDEKLALVIKQRKPGNRPDQVKTATTKL